MKKEQQDEIIKRIDNEMAEFKANMLNEDKQVIYENCYRINAHEEIADFIRNNIEDYSHKGFPLNEYIVASFYEEFIETNYDLTQEDLKYFIDRETRYYERQYKTDLATKIDLFLTKYAPYDRFDELGSFMPETDKEQEGLLVVKEHLEKPKAIKAILKTLEDVIQNDEREEIIKEAKELKEQVKEFDSLEM